MAYFRCVGGVGGGATLTLTYSSEFYGETITATDGTKTVTKVAPSTGTMDITLPESGTWVVSATIDGQTYSTTVTVNLGYTASLEAIPDGSTATPTDDIQTWLRCAGITDKTTYTTLADVLADTDTLIALCADSNACDYMARSTNWASGVAADSTAMLIVGKYNYCANTLLGNSTWATAIQNSPYSSYVDPEPAVYIPLVPVMTSNTTPSGECSATDYVGSQYPYLAFDGNDSTYWLSASTSPSSTNKYLTYQFPDKVKVSKIFMLPLVDSNGSHVKDFEIQASNDGTNWTKLVEDTYPNNDTSGYEEQYNTPIEYQFFRVYIKNFYAGNYAGISTFQVYKVSTLPIIHSAVEDSIFYMDEGTPVALCTIASGDTEDVDMSSFVGQTLTLVSTVAKDPDNLSNDFSMNVRITPNITEIYLMPVWVIYWYGVGGNNLTNCSSADGWSGVTYQTPTRNTDNIQLTTPGSGNGCGVYWTPTTAETVKVIAQGVTAQDGEYGWYSTSTVKDHTHRVNEQTVTSSSLVLLSGITVANNYSMLWVQGNRSCKYFAVWYE